MLTYGRTSDGAEPDTANFCHLFSRRMKLFTPFFHQDVHPNVLWLNLALRGSLSSTTHSIKNVTKTEPERDSLLGCYSVE